LRVGRLKEEKWCSRHKPAAKKWPAGSSAPGRGSQRQRSFAVSADIRSIVAEKRLADALPRRPTPETPDTTQRAAKTDRQIGAKVFPGRGTPVP
jgi:hypothetical protein